MYRKSAYFLIPVLVIVFLIFTVSSKAQIVRPNGNPMEASSQLIYYYATIDIEDSEIQVTNTSETEGTWIHVQIFRSFNANENPEVVDPVICDERDFVDFLTPNDTHVYDMDGQGSLLSGPPDGVIYKNMGETATTPGETASVNVVGSFGFIVITPVVSESDLTAISFQHLIGNTHESGIGLIIFDFGPEYILNAMGRDAVDFTTGEVLPDGTPLDGVSNGFVLLQPTELSFDFLSAFLTISADVVGIVFKDQYGPPGLLGYTVAPGDATWSTFIYDYKEDPTSCGQRQVNCFLSVGLNETLVQTVRELSGIPLFESVPLFSPVLSGDLLCSSVESPQLPNEPEGLILDVPATGWTRIFVSGLEGNENHIGLYIPGLFENAIGNSNIGAGWMYTNPK